MPRIPPDKPIYSIKLRGDGSQRDIHGLRFLLKQAWRQYQLKCVKVSLTTATEGTVG
jgi:hypothetical protein